MTFVVPVVIAASSYCPANESGTHFFVNWANPKRISVKEKDNTYHTVKLEIWRSCDCGASEKHPSFSAWEEQERHNFNKEVSGTRVNTGGKKIDDTYHYVVYRVTKKCECGRKTDQTGIVDKSKKVKHSYTKKISDITKANGKRVVVKECTCGARQTKVYDTNLMPQ